MNIKLYIGAIYELVRQTIISIYCKIRANARAPFRAAIFVNLTNGRERVHVCEWGYSRAWARLRAHRRK